MWSLLERQIFFYPIGPFEFPLFIVLTLLIPWVYFVALTSYRGQTLGKMALGIKVVNDEWHVPTVGRVLLRETIGKFVSSAVVMLGYLWAGWNAEKTGWHDMMAGTYVIRTR